jgi:ribosomal protein L24E
MHFPNAEINPQTIISCNVSEQKFSHSEIEKHGNRVLYVASDGSPLASIFSKELKNLLEILSPKTLLQQYTFKTQEVLANEVSIKEDVNSPIF